MAKPPPQTTFDNANNGTSQIGIPITNFTNAPAQVRYFADYNLNGNFDDQNEQGTIGPVPAGFSGLFTLTVTLGQNFYPQGSPLSVPFRFRLSSQTGLGPGGPAPDGEVEDHLLNLGTRPSGGDNGTDWGDLPASGFGPNSVGYDQSANHLATNDLFLGQAAADGESAAQPSSDATADDGADETLASYTVQTTFNNTANTATTTIGIPYTNNTNLAAEVRYFADFNLDGDYNDQLEQGTAGTALAGVSGNFTIGLTLPQSIYPQGTALLAPFRFRLSSQTGLGAGGPAPDGEVEDHLINLGTRETSPPSNNGTDYGDLPTPYDQSANHVATNNLYLGMVAGDGEAAAQPNANATGDDGVDEDPSEVTVQTTFDANNAAIVTVSVLASNLSPNAAQVSYFADLNLDGDFLDANENGLMGTIPAGGGSGFVGIQIPVSAGLYPASGPLSVPFRFRISSQTGLSVGGSAIDGEVEDHFLDLGTPPDLGPQLDFGDFPDSAAGVASGTFAGEDTEVPDYRTLAADDGPRHTIDPDLAILSNNGAFPAVDPDSDGQPTPGADGDDNDGSRDEEIGGISLSNTSWNFVSTNPPVSRYQGNGSISVPVLNNTGSDAFLKVWVDFNFDGDFDAAELVEDGSAAVSAGNSNVMVSFPFAFFYEDRCRLQNETLYFPIRYRLSSDASVGPYGPSTGTPPLGEVVDELYRLNGINTNELCSDYGDHPSLVDGAVPGVFGTSNPPDYRVRRNENGPFHEASSDLGFGSDISNLADKEADGLASADATGDGADENELFVAVTRLETTVVSTDPPSLSTVVEITGSLPVINTIGQDTTARVWLDADFDGLFEESERLPIEGGEVIPSVTAPDSGRTITFTMTRTIVSDTCTIDGTYYFPIRARISRSSNPRPFGNAGPGEVEDHLVVVNLLSPDLCARSGSLPGELYESGLVS